jgi:hypothetical protein
MEIYVLYNLSSKLLETFSSYSGTISRIVGLVLGILLWSALFALQGVGLAAMAKGQGVEKRWRAFVPFVNLFFMGKLAGECHIFSQRVKRIGLYAMLAQILTSTFCLLMIASELYLYLACGEPTKVIYDGIVYFLDWGTLTGFSKTVAKFFENGASILSIFQLVYEILMFVMIIGLYKKYSVRNHMTLSFLNLFVPLSRFIVIFILRKNQPVDYEALMRARREAYIRRQQYYNNPYGQNPYNRGYAQPQQPSQQPQTPPEDPFEEFASEDKENRNDTKQTDFFD